MNWLTMPAGITEPLLRDYLKEARGDLFIAASMAGCTPGQLRRCLRASPSLQVYYLAIERVKENGEFEKFSNDEFERALDAAAREYQYDGLEAIHEIATMRADTAALYEVKLKAAIALRGNAGGNQGGDTAAILAELNELYHRNAPRIKEIRTQHVQIEFHDEGTQERRPPSLEHCQIPPVASDTDAP